jgi:hypothetical protein
MCYSEWASASHRTEPASCRSEIRDAQSGNGASQERADYVPRLRTQALAVFVISTLAGMIACTDTKSQPTSKIVAEKPEAPVGESPEHAFAVHRYEASVANLAKLKKGLAKAEADRDAFNKSGKEDDGTGLTLMEEAQDYRSAVRALPAAISTARQQVEIVDSCLKMYRSTIDKRTSDLTTREIEGISVCRSLNSYPPAK